MSISMKKCKYLSINGVRNGILLYLQLMHLCRLRDNEGKTMPKIELKHAILVHIFSPFSEKDKHRHIRYNHENLLAT